MREILDFSFFVLMLTCYMTACLPLSDYIDVVICAQFCISEVLSSLEIIFNEVVNKTVIILCMSPVCVIV